MCPVDERAGGHAHGSVHPGPIGAVLSPRLTGVEDDASLPYASSPCGPASTPAAETASKLGRLLGRISALPRR